VPQGAEKSLNLECANLNFRNFLWRRKFCCRAKKRAENIRPQ